MEIWDLKAYQMLSFVIRIAENYLIKPPLFSCFLLSNMFWVQLSTHVLYYPPPPQTYLMGLAAGDKLGSPVTWLHHRQKSYPTDRGTFYVHTIVYKLINQQKCTYVLYVS